MKEVVKNRDRKLVITLEEPEETKNKTVYQSRLDSDESNREPSRKYLRRNKRANSYKNA